MKVSNIKRVRSGGGAARLRYIMTQLPLINQNNKKTFLDLLPHRVDQSILQKYLIYFLGEIALRLWFSLSFLFVLFPGGILSCCD